MRVKGKEIDSVVMGFVLGVSLRFPPLVFPLASLVDRPRSLHTVPVPASAVVFEGPIMEHRDCPVMSFLLPVKLTS